MRQVGIVFTADNHLGRYYSKMTATQLSKRRERLRHAFTQTVDYAIEQDCAFYLHGGDLFDSCRPRTSALVWTARQFRRLRDAGVRILAVGGGHDVPRMRIGGATPQRIYSELGIARVFTKVNKVEFERYEMDGINVAIGGLPPDPRLERGDDPLEGVDIAPPQADVVLLLTHYGVEGTIHPRAQEPFLSRRAVADLKEVDFLFAGHVHRSGRLQIGEVTVLISGATERMNFGEVDNSPGFWYLELKRVKSQRRVLSPRLHYIRLNPQPMHRVEVRTTNIPSEEPTSWLLDRIRDISQPDLLLQCRIEGPLPRELYHHVRFYDVWSAGNELNFFFDLDRRGVYLETEAPPEAEPFADRVSRKEEIERVTRAMIKEADPDKEELIREAKELLLSKIYAT